MHDAKVFLTSGGGDSIEVAAKLARRHFVNLGQPERVHLISRTQGYHGTHGFGTSLGGIEANVDNWGPLVPQTSIVPYDSLPALEAEILEVGPDKVAAFFCEPVIGAGGVCLPPEGYIQGVADLCAEHGILLVIDSVICGFGRLGTWFGVERWQDVRAGHDHLRQGRHERLHPARRRRGRASKIAEPYYDGPAAADVPPRRHLRGPPGGVRRRAGGAGHLRRRGSDSARAGARSAARRRAAPLADHPAVGEVRAGLGFLAAIGLHPEPTPQPPARLAAGAREQASSCAAPSSAVSPCRRR